MANKFERDVQKKLEVLEFTPSPSVWQQVEKRISRKKRRRTFFLLFPLILLIALTALFLLHTTKESRLPVPPQENSPQSTHSTIKEKVQADGVPKTPAGNSKFGTLQHTAPKTDPSPKTNYSSKTAVDRPHQERLSAPTTIGFSDHPVAKSTSKLPLRTTSLQQNDPLLYIPRSKTELIQNTGEVLSIKKESLSFPKAPGKEYQQANNTERVRNDPDSPLPNSKQTNNTWIFGFSVTPGISFTNNNFLGFPGSSPNYDYSYSPGPGSGLPPTVNPQPLKLKSGFAFSVALNASKPLSAKTVFHTGVEYQYFSIYQQIAAPGGIENSAQPDNPFLSQFHYLTIPAGFRFKNNIGKKQVVLEIGAGASGLISARALQFDNRQYHRSDWRRMQIQARGGVYIDLLNRNNFKIMVGPYYQYNLHQPVKTGILADKHFNFAGLKTEIQIKK